MKTLILFITLFLSVSFVSATEPLRVIMIGAHPDDCDISGGGTAALFAQMGHKVKFVSLTNGDKGHHLMKPEELAARRKKESQVFEWLPWNNGYESQMPAEKEEIKRLFPMLPR